MKVLIRWLIVSLGVLLAYAEDEEEKLVKARQRAIRKKYVAYAFALNQAVKNSNASVLGSHPMLEGYQRSGLVSGMLELLENAETVEERGATCVRRLFGRKQMELSESVLDWEAYDQGVEKFLATNGVYSKLTPALRFDTIGEESEIPKLRGERGAFATRRIEPGECLGQYIGDEMLFFEFEANYPWHDGTEEDRKKWFYAMHVAYDRSSNDRTMKRYANRKPDPFIARKKAIPPDMIVSTVSDPTKSSVALVNDCRLRMDLPDPTPADLERLNAEFVYCDVDSAMFPFLVATRAIEPNQQVFAYYGPSFLLHDDDEALHSARGDL